jgi:hypothetical protein
MILGDRIRRGEARRELRHRPAARVDAKETAVAAEVAPIGDI